MIKGRIRAGQSYGKWNDESILHPVPTMNEPNKAVSWLTARASLDEDRKPTCSSMPASPGSTTCS